MPLGLFSSIQGLSQGGLSQEMFGMSKKQRKREGRLSSLDGTAVNLDPSAPAFSSTGKGKKKGVLTPGQDVTIRGQNDFLSAARETETQLGGLQGIADQRGLSEAVQGAADRTGESFRVAEGELERRQRGLGVAQSGRGQAARARQFGLARAVATADTQGNVRRGYRDRAEEAQREAANIESGLRDTEQQTNIGLSEIAAAKFAARQQKKASKKASVMSGVTAVAGAAMMFSSEDVKHDKRATNEDGSLLDRLRKVRVEKWKYIGDDKDHIGPYAEEFNDTFHVGKGNRGMINIVDAVGVLMGSLKELDARVTANG